MQSYRINQNHTVTEAWTPRALGSEVSARTCRSISHAQTDVQTPRLHRGQLCFVAGTATVLWFGSHQRLWLMYSSRNRKKSSVSRCLAAFEPSSQAKYSSLPWLLGLTFVFELQSFLRDFDASRIHYYFKGWVGMFLKTCSNDMFDLPQGNNAFAGTHISPKSLGHGSQWH